MEKRFKNYKHFKYQFNLSKKNTKGSLLINSAFKNNIKLNYIKVHKIFSI